MNSLSKLQSAIDQRALPPEGTLIICYTDFIKDFKHRAWLFVVKIN
jgi:hypothetical protein